MKAIYILVGAGIIILMLSAIVGGLNAFLMKDQVDPYNVTTTGGVTTYAATLSQSLFNNDTALAAVTSNITPLDAPIASTYVPATKALTITGLAASQTRTLYVTYKIDNLTFFPGAAIFAKWGPAFLIIGIIGIVIAAIMAARS